VRGLMKIKRGETVAKVGPCMIVAKVALVPTA
jgi:hypothetical protein